MAASLPHRLKKKTPISTLPISTLPTHSHHEPRSALTYTPVTEPPSSRGAFDSDGGSDFSSEEDPTEIAPFGPPKEADPFGPPKKTSPFGPPVVDDSPFGPPIVSSKKEKSSSSSLSSKKKKKKKYSSEEEEDEEEAESVFGPPKGAKNVSKSSFSSSRGRGSRGRSDEEDDDDDDVDENSNLGGDRKADARRGQQATERDDGVDYDCEA